MNTIRKDSRVAVNLAPFIGSSSASKHHVPCRVLELGEGSVFVRAEEPYRNVSLWVETRWVERLESDAGEHATGRRIARPVRS